MYGGDSVFGRMTSTSHPVYRDTGVDSDLDHKAHRVTDKLSESINTIANEPSVAFYRIQEHVRKTLPQLVEQKHEVEEVQQLVQGACFDTEYAGNAVKGMEKSVVHFQNIQELLKNAMFMKQQIDYEEARGRQNRLPGGNGRQEGSGGTRTEEGSDNMDDSAVSTDSSLAASGHANTEDDSQMPATATGKEPSEEEDSQQEKDGAEIQTTQEQASVIEGEDKLEEGAERENMQEKDTVDREEKATEEREEEKQQAEDLSQQESTQHDSSSNANTVDS